MYGPFQLPILPLEALLVMVVSSIIFFLSVCVIKTVEEMIKITSGGYSRMNSWTERRFFHLRTRVLYLCEWSENYHLGIGEIESQYLEIIVLSPNRFVTIHSPSPFSSVGWRWKSFQCVFNVRGGYILREMEIYLIIWERLFAPYYIYWGAGAGFQWITIIATRE